MKEEMGEKKLLVLDKAMGVLSEARQLPKQGTQGIPEEEAFGIVVAKTLPGLGKAEKILAK